MHILLTNDDGYQAEGIRQLAEYLTQSGHRVSICAPDREKSAASHAISITQPLRAKEISLGCARGWAVDGTPVDSARLGLYLLRNDRPDACISGVNRGPNLGGACIYSGTVNSAMEASMAGCPSIAVSLNSFVSNDYSLASSLAEKLVRWAVDHPLRRGEIYSMNVPCQVPFRGVYFTQTLGPEFLTDAMYQEFVSDYKNTYFFLDDGPNEQFFPPESDSVKCAEGWATVSVLTWDIAARRPDLPANGTLSL